MVRLVTDVEADSLNPTRIWCVVDIDIDTDEVYVWRYDRDVLPYNRTCDLRVGHNMLDYDGPVLNRLATRGCVDYRRCIDTLVCSRLFNQQVQGGHSLESWGVRLGLPKGDFQAWAALEDPVAEAERMERCVEYCIQDVRITLAIYRKLEKAITSSQWRQSLRIEHDTAILCRELHDNGFAFDYESGKSIEIELQRMVEDLSQDLQKAFLPRSRIIREIYPRTTKFGTLNRTDFRWKTSGDLSGYSADAPFSRFEYVSFNPASPSQVVERLNEAGWKPFEKTEGYKDAEKRFRDLRIKIDKNRKRDSESIALQKELEDRIKEYEIYGWKVSEENLETLPDDAPEGCKLFVKWRMLSKRLQTLEEWSNAYNSADGRIHGRFTHIGAWTHRMSHSDPNMGNVPSMDSKYHSSELKDLAKTFGVAMRSCWRVPDDRVLVGVDAEGIQLRVLAHYMRDQEFIEALINGKKDDEHPEASTDVHTLNANKLGFDFRSRPRAKTFIYAWLLGAGVGKIAKILGVSDREGSEAIRNFISGYPGLQHLKESVIPNDSERGYFEGFDGRLIRSDEYHMLAGYLQAGEACVMKRACQIWMPELRRFGIEYRLVNYVHDEWQTETCYEFADEVARIQKQSIVQAGIDFGLYCPLAGSSKIGKNWMETH